MKDAKGHGSEGRGGRTLDRWSGQSHVAQIAAQHKISGGPVKVQSLNTKLAGSPWQTQKRYGNRTVAERVAQHMRTDGHYVRVK